MDTISGAPIAVSLRARGLTALDAPRAQPLACRALTAAASRQVASLFCALLTAIVTLPPWAWFSALLCSLTAIFFVASESAALTDGLVVTFGVGAVGMVIYMAAAAVARRDRAAYALGRVKACIIGMDTLAAALAVPQRPHSAAEDDGASPGCTKPRPAGQPEDLRAASMQLMDALHDYLGGPPRPNTEGFSWSLLSTAASPGPTLYKLSADIGARLRRVQASVRALGAAAAGLGAGAGAGGGAVTVAMLQQVAALHEAVEELSAIKELRTPLLLRVTARSNVVLVAPILTGSALAGLARTAPGAAAVVWSVAVGCMLQLLLASLLAVATHLEDPFASPHPDALSLWEARDGVGYMLYGNHDTGVLPGGPAAAAAAASPAEPGGAGGWRLGSAGGGSAGPLDEEAGHGLRRPSDGSSDLHHYHHHHQQQQQQQWPEPSARPLHAEGGGGVAAKPVQAGQRDSSSRGRGAAPGPAMVAMPPMPLLGG